MAVFIQSAWILVTFALLSCCDCLHHDHLQFSVYNDTVKGFHAIDPMGNTIVFLNFKITRAFAIVNSLEFNYTLKTCRQRCRVSPFCNGATWLSSTKECLIGRDYVPMKALRLTPDHVNGAMTQIKIQTKSTSYPALDGWFYQQSLETITYRHAFPEVCSGKNMTFAFPSNQFQLENMLQFQKDRNVEMRINLLGNPGTGKMYWNYGQILIENRSELPVTVTWDESVYYPTFIINNNGEFQAVSPERLFTVMCMDDKLGLHNP